MLVGGGKLSINIIDTQGDYFRSFKGSRQGDPISPLLFNLVVDAFPTMIQHAKENGTLKGAVTHLVPGGVSHLQYANDTILMIEKKDEYVIILKFILYCFEVMSGIKINDHKIAVCVFGGDDHEKRRIANMLNCQLESLSVVYLGIPIPISDHKLTTEEMQVINGKMRKRLIHGGASFYLSEGD